MKESHSSHTLALIALALGAVAVTVATVIGGLIYTARWLSSNAFAFQNPAYMTLIVVGALVGGIVLMGVFLIAHDAVDAWGDAYKAKAEARELTQADIERAAMLAKVRRDHAAAAKDEREAAPVLLWQDDAVPWPAAENGHAGPKEFGG